MLEEDHGGPGLVTGGDAVEGEDVSVLCDHLMALHWVASLQHHPVSGLAVLLPMEQPGGYSIGVLDSCETQGPPAPAEQ